MTLRTRRLLLLAVLLSTLATTLALMAAGCVDDETPGPVQSSQSTR